MRNITTRSCARDPDGGHEQPEGDDGGENDQCDNECGHLERRLSPLRRQRISNPAPAEVGNYAAGNGTPRCRSVVSIE
jgi:hypothetical protein